MKPYPCSKYKNYLLIYYLVWPIPFIRQKFTINTHRSILHLIMINYKIIIEEFLLGTNKLHGLIEIWPMDILKWKIYDPIIYLKAGAIVVLIVWIYNYLCNHCRSPLKLWVRIPLRRGILYTTLCEKVCQWLATGQWFSPCTPVSCTNQSDRHDIAELLLKVAYTINQSIFESWKSPPILAAHLYILL